MIHELKQANLLPKHTSFEVKAIFLPALPPSIQRSIFDLGQILNCVS